jgi:hypothetical protein
MSFFIVVVGRWSDASGCHTFWTGICGLNTLVIGAFLLLCVQFSATLHYVHIVGIRGRTIVTTVSVLGQVFI